MAIIKPTKPDSELPKTWGGTQYPYTEEQIAEGLPEAIPTIIDGGTLNYEKKGVFERMEYVTQVSDAVAGAPIKKTLITNANNQFEYAGIGVYSYSATQTYALDDYVIYSTNEGTKIYKSLSNNNIGKELTNETYWEELSLGGGGSGLEIGDIGIAPLGIDETKNKRRYLNGQIISQVQFVSFTNKIKKAIALFPNIATTEGNWQAEVTNSKLGQCGKFVIDDVLGTIRLPRVVNINGLQDLSLLGGIKSESLPKPFANIGDGLASYVGSGGTNAFVAGPYVQAQNYTSDTYQDNAPVQQEAIQYPYFIQVATGVEESVDVTREIELNNPFSLLDYKWSEYEITNASWLISNGAFHSGATYKAVYELLLKIHNGTETKDGVSVKLSTEAYEDTDFVLNTSNTSFRLPIKVKLASGNAVVGNGMALGLTDGTNNAGLIMSNSNYIPQVSNEAFGQNLGTTTYPQGPTWGSAGTAVGVTTDPTKSGLVLADNDMYLYFYVGETVQDANVINASGVLTRVANCIERTNANDRETVVGWGMPDYSARVSLTVQQLLDGYTAPVDGVVTITGQATNGSYFLVDGVGVGFVGGQTSQSYAPVEKGSVVSLSASLNILRNIFFYPLKGVN